jgi:formamidopyrimidine-DNA glycosylase
MPELPEVETIMRGLRLQIKNAVIKRVILRRTQLRWPIPSDLNECLAHQEIIELSRRGKYLLIQLTSGTLIVHLGMSGSLRILTQEEPPTKHDHVDIILSDNQLLRYNDPRRFGAILWTSTDPLMHPLLKSIGIEPLDTHFTGQYLIKQCLNRRTPIKALLMNSKIVTGIGNIYAAEALFLARIHPATSAGQLTTDQCFTLVDVIKKVLSAAISQGGTTLKDFVNSDGKPGYFSQSLHVYGRANNPCTACGNQLEHMLLGQRSTVFCNNCQPLQT